MEKKTGKITLTDIILFLILALVAIYELAHLHVTNDLILRPIVDMTITRILAGIFFLIILVKRKYNVFSFYKDNKFKNIICAIPAFIVAFNNLPIIPIIKYEVKLQYGLKYILLLALECLAIGFFEEVAFRGLFFVIYLQNHRQNRFQLFITVALTSIVFGMYHLFNLFSGASVGGTLLQVGYSALIGAMCAVVFLKTGNLILCIMIHAIYDFCGQLYSYLGTGTIWTNEEILLTFIVSIIVVVLIIYIFMKLNINNTDHFYQKIQ